MNDREINAVKNRWPVQNCFSSRAVEPSDIREELGRLFKLLHCLPGAGFFIVIADNGKTMKHELPFSLGYIERSVLVAFYEAMIFGGGCEIRLRISDAMLVFGVCLRYRMWCGCTDDQLRDWFIAKPGEIAVSFPETGSVERVRSACDRQ